MLRDLASLLAPPCCGVCGEPCRSSERVCGACGDAIAATQPCPLLIPGIERGWAAAPYEGVPRRLVASLKFGHRLALARVAAHAIASRVPEDEPLGVLVPVPPDPLRRRWRGFDPAHAIAHALARELRLPLSTCLVRPPGRRQVGRSRGERLAAGPSVRAREAPPSPALLVDDVVTTGATLSACARALRTAGTKRVLAVTFARA